jgi:hypothetical protein
MRPIASFNRWLGVVAAAVALAGCGGGGGGDSAFCSAAGPTIKGSPRTAVSVGKQYTAAFDASYECLLIFRCGAITLLQGPAGAGTSGAGVFWTAPQAFANTSASFRVSTNADGCGRTATHSWTVAVHPLPTIQSFTSSASDVFAGQPVQLTAAFEGSGNISGIGSVASGIAVTTQPISVATQFTLTVSNALGEQLSQSLQIGLIGPPAIKSFTATPQVIGDASSTTLAWTLDGTVSAAQIDPGAIDVRGRFDLVVSPTATVGYTLTVSNSTGATTSSTTVQVVQGASVQSFTVAPASTGLGGTVNVSAVFAGSGFIDQEIDGTYQAVGPIISGSSLASAQMFGTTKLRLRVQNTAGDTIPRELTVPVTGPGTYRPASGQPRGARIFHAAALLADGRVFIAGGRAVDGGNASLDHTTEIFDPASETFTFGPALLKPPRWFAEASVQGDGQVHIVGGELGTFFSSPLVSGEVYDPAVNLMSAFSAADAAITQDAAMFSRARFADGRILVPAKITQSGATQRGVVAYQPGSRTYGSLASFVNGPRFYDAAAVLGDGRALLVGADGVSETYAPASNRLSSAPATSARGFGVMAVALLDGRVLLVGGQNAAGAFAELYDGVSNSVARAGASSLGNRLYQVAGTISGGRILLVGGKDTASVEKRQSEIFDPTTGTFTRTGDLPDGRYGHTVTRLADGRFLVFGGCPDRTTCPAQIYTP